MTESYHQQQRPCMKKELDNIKRITQHNRWTRDGTERSYQHTSVHKWLQLYRTWVMGHWLCTTNRKRRQSRRYKRNICVSQKTQWHGVRGVNTRPTTIYQEPNESGSAEDINGTSITSTWADVTVHTTHKYDQENQTETSGNATAESKLLITTNQKLKRTYGHTQNRNRPTTPPPRVITVTVTGILKTGPSKTTVTQTHSCIDGPVKWVTNWQKFL